MEKFKIIHEREECIGCGACEAVAPEFWEIDNSDGKANLKEGKEIEEGIFEKEIEEKDLEPNKEAAQSCPVSIIKIKDSKGQNV